MNAQQIRNIRPDSLRKFKRMKLSYKEMAEKCGVSIRTIENRLREYGLIRYNKKSCGK